MNKEVKMKDIIRFLYLFAGLFSFSFAFTFFLLPHNLVFGGISGLSILFKELFNWNTSLFVLIVDICLLLISFPILGKKKTIGSILGSLLLPAFLAVMGLISDATGYVNDDLFICSIFGGVFSGIGLGLCFKAGFSTGGTDIVNQIIHIYFKISLGKSMFILDGLIVTSGAFVFGFTKFMYAVMVLYIMTVMTDRVILGVGRSKAFYIVTDKTQEVKKYIIDTLGHSVTVFDATGGYSKETQKVVFCVIPTREYFKLEEGINKIDDEAFFIVTEAYEVYGGK